MAYDIWSYIIFHILFNTEYKIYIVDVKYIT